MTGYLECFVLSGIDGKLIGKEANGEEQVAYSTQKEEYIEENDTFKQKDRTPEEALTARVRVLARRTCRSVSVANGLTADEGTKQLRMLMHRLLPLQLLMGSLLTKQLRMRMSPFSRVCRCPDSPDCVQCC
jgi:hypothetical protein